jgi:hypothetical protein
VLAIASSDLANHVAARLASGSCEAGLRGCAASALAELHYKDTSA